MNNAPREAEQFWHQWLLIAILVIATCARFYALDHLSLTGDALASLTISHARDWLAMISDNYNHSGMTPLHPILLRLFTNLTDTSEFFVRTVSALAGLVSIYFIYISGRDFISPVTGLLAAAVMATEYQVLFMNRDATLYSLLLLCCLIHNYCFCRLFLSANRYQQRPLVIGRRGRSIDFEWVWRPRFPADARCLAGFWISGILAFYTSPMALIQLLSEVLASAFFIKTAASHFPSWRAAMRSLWLPLFIALLPWLPIFYRSWHWVREGNLFAFQDLIVLWERIQGVLPISPVLLNLSIALAALLILFIVTLRLLKINHLVAFPLIYFILFQFGIASLSLWLILPASPLSYFYYWWIFVLLILIPVSIGIDTLPSPLWKKSLVAIAILLIVVVQVKSNAYYTLYSKEKSGDFRLVAKIIHDDQDFMKGHRDIVMSSNLFQHHLEKNGITLTNFTLIDSNTRLDSNNASTSSHEALYYLEYTPYERDSQNETPAFQSVAAQYKQLCMTKLPWIRIVKFSRDPSVTENKTQDCQAYLSEAITLK